MCYRYIYLFIEIIENTYLAIKSRVGTGVHYKKGQHIVAWNMATLWKRSYQLNEEVHQAMLSRGYRGEPLLWDDFRIKAKDWLWLFSAVVILGIVFYYNHQMRG
jgi:cobalt/nickel transport system permease protein